MKAVDPLKTTLRGYGFDLFQNTAPREISTRSEIDKNMLSRMIRVDDLGESQAFGVIVSLSINLFIYLIHYLNSITRS